MGQIVDAIKEHQPDRVRAYCGECGFEFFDSARNGKTDSLRVVEADISIMAKKHRDETMESHDDLQVDLDKPNPEVQEIDVTINVT